MVLISVANIGLLQKHNMKISICADDIGQDIEITDASLNLFDQQRLNKISILIQGPAARQRVHEISLAREKGLEVGLHFNLTLRFNDTDFCMPLNQLIILSQLRLLPSIKINQQIEIQLKLFEDTFQFKPDFIDGHQHVHQFPQIREELIRVIKEFNFNDPNFWIRSTILPINKKDIPEKFKCNLLNILGGYQFIQMLNNANIQFNKGFLGVYNFNAPNTRSYRLLMQKWLSLAEPNALIMCHPALSAIENDAIGIQRKMEYEYLSSEKFVEDLEQFNCKLF